MPDLYACTEAWYCLKALPKKEHLAATMLIREADIEAFAPRIRYTKKTARGRVRFVEALFPGYVFARTALKDSYRHVMSMHGVRGVVSYGNIVPRIPDGFIAEIKNRLAVEAGDPVEDQDPALQAGKEVTVIDGPFINWHGIITGVVPARNRVKVLLELLGQQLSVELPAHALYMDGQETPHQRALKA